MFSCKATRLALGLCHSNCSKTSRLTCVGGFSYCDLSPHSLSLQASSTLINFEFPVCIDEKKDRARISIILPLSSPCICTKMLCPASVIGAQPSHLRCICLYSNDCFFNDLKRSFLRSCVCGTLWDEKLIKAKTTTTQRKLTTT